LTSLFAEVLHEFQTKQLKFGGGNLDMDEFEQSIFLPHASIWKSGFYLQIFYSIEESCKDFFCSFVSKNCRHRVSVVLFEARAKLRQKVTSKIL
jgi:hypothetical protein